mmetsp:Transcript_6179/g.20144  ORF Transcript_6179/g.20144 Transcript_6179/m.20144 type:complete len:665 (-) Transcript_6179:1552-3546(-)
MLREVPLDELPGLLGVEAQQKVDLIDVPRVEPDGVPRLRRDVLEAQVLVRRLRQPRELRRPRQTQDQQVQDEAVELEHEARELEAPAEAVGIRVHHVLVGDGHVVLRRHVVGDVVVDDEPEEPVQQSQVDLLVDLLQLGLEHHDALAVRRVPDLLQIIHALAPLVAEQGRRLRVPGLDPIRKQMPLVRLVPEVLVEVRIRNLLEGLHFVDGDQVRVQVHELQRHLLEGPLRQEVPFNARQRFVGIVVGLLDEPQLLPLVLIQPRVDPVVLLEPLQREDQQLRVVLVRQRRKRDGRELARLEPVHRQRVDRHALLRRHVRPVLQVVVLPLLLRLEPQPRQPTEVLLAHRLVDRRAALDAFAVVVRDVRPPIGLGLDVPEDHVLHGRRQPRHLPRNVRLPAAPGFREVLEDRLGLVGLDALGHHVEDVVHDGGAEFEVEVRLDALLRDGLGDALGVAALELAGEQVAEPPLEEGHDAPEEEEPDAPPRRPEADPRPFADGARVEARVDQVLEVLALAHLPHEPILVAVHPGELADVGEDVLEAVRELEGVDVSEAILHHRVDDELRQSQDLSAVVHDHPVRHEVLVPRHGEIVDDFLLGAFLDVDDRQVESRRTRSSRAVVPDRGEEADARGELPEAHRALEVEGRRPRRWKNSSAVEVVAHDGAT